MPVSFRLDSENLVWLRDEAEHEDRTIGWLVNEAVTDYRMKRDDEHQMVRQAVLEYRERRGE